MVADSADRPELIAGRYRLMDRIGSGGMGHVWLAWDERLNRAVAVKQLHPPVALDESDAAVARERAMREARNTARLHHPNAVPVFDVVDHEGRPCLVMQYLPSQSLQAVLHERGPLPVREVARLGSELASALAAAHGADLVHRDVKPGNVLLAEDGTARITDFGISHALGDASLTSTGMVTGTPAYLAPEVARGAPSTPASDVFSLGATLYAALEGSPPFGTGDNAMALLHRVASGAITPPSETPLAPVLLRMLSVSPEERPSMQDVSAVLGDVAAGRSVPDDGVDRTRVLPPAATVSAGAAAGLDLADGTSPTARTAVQPEAQADPTGSEGVEPRTAAGPPARDGESRGRRRAVLAGLVLLLLVGGGLLATSLLRDGSATGGATPPPVVAGTTRSSQASPSSSSRPTTSTAPPPSPSTPAATTTPTPTTSSPSAPATTSPGSASDLAGAVRDYYRLLPDNTDAGWARLTDRYRATTAKDRATYDRFWASVDAVSVGQAKASGPGSVVATVRYDFRDGRRYEERTAFTLVEQDGVLKIDTSKVQNSSQL
ncbi:serine/threonine-protein kinase [Terrabacter sp. NPDC080008]|uniref:serine/threonine-protein kinase n=1 Tax=Terrabacter sp. NPDC080008 TaxID=3155176 RepID=UPI00344B5023